jgi:hypothetical protein
VYSLRQWIAVLGLSRMLLDATPRVQQVS